MAGQYERFDDETPAPKFTIVANLSTEDVNLFHSPSQDDRNTRHAMITLNIISVFVSLVCGIITFFLAIEDRSTSALGFAVDTILDVLSFIAIIWRFTSANEQTKREVLVLRVLAILFFISGLGVFVDSIEDFRERIHPLTNYYLVIAAAVQTLIFFSLALAKYIVAKKLNVISAYSDVFNTFMAGLTACSIGITITIYNSNKNVWYLDPIIGMIISIVIMFYGIWMMYKSFKKS